MFSISNYRAPGPVSAEFIRADDHVPFLMGPVGSGKTNATIFKALRYTALLPACTDGVVRAKGAVVRTDYRTLYKTVLPSWWRWFPRDYPESDYTGGADRPAIHTLRFRTPRGRRIELIVEFTALGENRIEDVLRGWEGTWAWMNEADLLLESALNFLYQRTGRYPPKSLMEGRFDLPPRVFGDLNPPGDPDHWVVKRFIDRERPGRDSDPFAAIAPDDSASGLQIYQQPSGLSAQAENIENLPKGYYERMASMLPAWDVHRFVAGKIGYSRDGLPVYPEFDFARHVAPQVLRPVPGIPLKLGFDGGLHPACTINQDMPNGQWRILRECYWGRMGPGRFAELLATILQDEFRDIDIAYGVYDPSSDYGADREHGDQSWVDIVRLALSITMLPSPSNEPTVRIAGVSNLLRDSIDSATSTLLLSPNCTYLKKGFATHYRFKLAPNGQVLNRDNPRPEKNEYSNVHDALQYPVLLSRGRHGVIAAAARGRMAGSLGERTGGNRVLASEFSV